MTHKATWFPEPSERKYRGRAVLWPRGAVGRFPPSGRLQTTALQRCGVPLPLPSWGGASASSARGTPTPGAQRNAPAGRACLAPRTCPEALPSHVLMEGGHHSGPRVLPHGQTAVPAPTGVQTDRQCWECETLRWLREHTHLGGHSGCFRTTRDWTSDDTIFMYVVFDRDELFITER